MNILLVSRGWPTLRDPHWGCFEKDQAEALKALGHEVKVICLDSRFRLKYQRFGFSRTTINGIDYWGIRLVPYVLLKLVLGNSIAIKFGQRMLERLYEKVADEGFLPDVVYSHFVYNSAMSVALKKKYHLPLVVIEHASELAKDRISNIMNALALEAYRNADTMITVSAFLSSKIRKRFSVNSIVLPNMLSKEFIEAKFESKKNGNNRVRFISIGSLIPRKGFEELIKSFSRANLDKKRWRLDIVGYGNLKGHLEKMIQILELSDNIHLLGAKSKHEIIELLGQADVFVLNSKLETFGVVYIEALAMGVPCIATECGGAEGIVNKGDGINVPVGKEEALTAAIKEMAARYTEYNKSEIRQRCLKNYSPIIIAKRIENILKETITKCSN